MKASEWIKHFEEQIHLIGDVEVEFYNIYTGNYLVSPTIGNSIKGIISVDMDEKIIK